ncbi:unnamed protein product [Periconia digitata]|uniref:Uncharacterized protein n=1 Tax=Periconia digitata TaxID=1303443 RepID=A0A9W4UX46_9PLEO|nr:unnamed protein product [Periconia digitata]
MPTGDYKSRLADIASSEKSDAECETIPTLYSVCSRNTYDILDDEEFLKRSIVRDDNKSIVDGVIPGSVWTNARPPPAEPSTKIIHSIEDLNSQVETNQQFRQNEVMNDTKREAMHAQAGGKATSSSFRQRSEKQTYNYLLPHKRIAEKIHESNRSPSKCIRNISSGSIDRFRDKVNINAEKLALTYTNLRQSQAKDGATDEISKEVTTSAIYPGSPTEVATEDGNRGELGSIRDNEHQQNSPASGIQSDTEDKCIPIIFPVIPVLGNALNVGERILPPSASQDAFNSVKDARINGKLNFESRVSETEQTQCAPFNSTASSHSTKDLSQRFLQDQKRKRYPISTSARRETIFSQNARPKPQARSAKVNRSRKSVVPIIRKYRHLDSSRSYLHD